MPITLLASALRFPHPSQAERGLVAVGGDLSPERLLLAYQMGIFPWYEEGGPILWHSPDPRALLPLDRLHIGRTLRRVLVKAPFRTTFDTAFNQVIVGCQMACRPGQDGTWITDEMVAAYQCLHDMGYAHSVEVWEEGHLVGGIYGVSLGRMFFGESMFSLRPDASKVALVTLARAIAAWGFRYIDAQVSTPTTAAFGVELWPRRRFLELLREELREATRVGRWGPPA